MIWPPILQDLQAEFTIFSMGLWWMQDREKIFGTLNSEVGWWAKRSYKVGMDGYLEGGLRYHLLFFERSLNEQKVRRCLLSS